jgi:DNA-binding transcriptional ArsR family regulator
MEISEQFKSVAALIGEPVRATMLWSLLDGKAFTATELAIHADVSAQSASMHLKKLVESNLLTIEKQGRHRYYRFSRPEIAYVIESMANLMSLEKKKTVSQVNISSLSSITHCRTCYDHLAGQVGVLITNQLLDKKIIIALDKEYDVTPKGTKWFENMGVNVGELKNQKRIFARQCLDWSERRHHLAGALGAALLNSMLTLGWMRRAKDSRMVMVTSKGQSGLYETLKLIL